MTELQLTGADDSPVLVVVMNNPADLAHARDSGWYRIPLASAPPRIAAEYLAFYLTAAFPADERWSVCWAAPVRDYRIALRRELIPDEPDHPRADDRYYRIGIGSLVALPQPIPSRRLRRITFLPTTLGRLLSAAEINDLWIKTPAGERLWHALKQADLDAEYALTDDLAGPAADFALFCAEGRIAVILKDVPQGGDRVREGVGLDYPLAAGDWCAVHVTREQLYDDLPAWMEGLTALVQARGGLRDP
jgi:hypothetical protein